MPADPRWRGRSSGCDAVAGSLPAYVAGEAELDPTGTQHLAQCLRCQADVARYRRMLRALHALRSETEDPPPGMLAGILTRLDGGRRATWVPEPWAALGLAMLAGALGATGVLVWSSRRRAGCAG